MAKRVLVTGYGGFLGSEVTRQLIARGDSVIGFGRGDYPRLVEFGVQAVRGDVRDADAITRAAEGVDAVIHIAALAGVWGPWQDYYAINTVGTQNVIRACQLASVPVMVYCSSPSVTFDGHDQTGIDEAAPYPSTWLSPYPHTKALGEQAVIAAHAPPKLATAALRPHLIWGAEDPHLFPRLIQRARSGRLRIVGDGSNRIDTVHVVNAAAAHIAAVDRLGEEISAATSETDGLTGDRAVGGRAYFITQDDPLLCWEWIAQVLEIAGAPLPKKRISLAAAWRIGHAFEIAYRLAGRRSEPPMTRFVAAQLACDHYFDISAAKKRLGYHPKVSTEAGLEELREKWHSAG